MHAWLHASFIYFNLICIFDFLQGEMSIEGDELKATKHEEADDIHDA